MVLAGVGYVSHVVRCVLIVGNSALSAVRCALFVVWCSLCVVWRLPFAVCASCLVCVRVVHSRWCVVCWFGM